MTATERGGAEGRQSETGWQRGRLRQVVAAGDAEENRSEAGQGEPRPGRLLVLPPTSLAPARVTDPRRRLGYGTPRGLGAFGAAAAADLGGRRRSRVSTCAPAQKTRLALLLCVLRQQPRGGGRGERARAMHDGRGKGGFLLDARVVIG